MNYYKQKSKVCAQVIGSKFVHVKSVAGSERRGSAGLGSGKIVYNSL